MLISRGVSGSNVYMVKAPAGFMSDFALKGICVVFCNLFQIRWHLQRHIESFVHMTCVLISAITTAYLEWKGEGEGE